MKEDWTLEVILAINRKYLGKINRICCENRRYFSFHTKPNDPKLASKLESFDVSAIVKYSYHFAW